MNSLRDQSQDPPLPNSYRHGLQIQLAILLEAHLAAVEFAWAPARCAVSFHELQQHGGTVNQFRWLLENGYIEAVPCAPAQHGPGLPPELVAMLLDPVRYVLTPAGVGLAHGLAGTEAAPAVDTGRPRWDAALRTLWVGPVVVKRYRVPAQNQEIVLSTFEEEGWPPTIDDPIPQDQSCDSKARLHYTIRRLNSHQSVRRVRFTGNGRGDGVSWKLVRAE